MYVLEESVPVELDNAVALPKQWPEYVIFNCLNSQLSLDEALNKFFFFSFFAYGQAQLTSQAFPTVYLVIPSTWLGK